MALNSDVGSPFAESMVGVEEADAYHGARGTQGWLDLHTDQKEQALRRGTQFIIGKYRGRWKGVRTFVEQSMPWPRTGVLDEDGVLLPDNIIPWPVMQAVCEASWREAMIPGALTAPDPSKGRLTKTETVGPISITYMDGALPEPFIVFDDALSGLLINGGRTSGGFSTFARA